MMNEKRKMNRTVMLENCRNRMSAYTDAVLAEESAGYFDKNRTMPGEKTMKDIAMAQREAARQYKNLTSDSPDSEPWKWNRNVPDKYVMDRQEFISGMGEIAVKDVEFHGSSYPFRLTKTAPHFDSMIADRQPDEAHPDGYTHEFVATVNGKGKYSMISFTTEQHYTYAAIIPAGFATNHPDMAGMAGVFTVLDPSKGNRGNANLMFSVDLMQHAEMFMPDELSLPDSKATPYDAISKEESAFRHRKPYEQQQTLPDMEKIRDELVDIRKEELSKLGDMHLVKTICSYYKHNAVMPGEKVLRDLAEFYDGAIPPYEIRKDGTHPYMDEFRDDMIDMFAKVSVQEAKVKDLNVDGHIVDIGEQIYRDGESRNAFHEKAGWNDDGHAIPNSIFDTAHHMYDPHKHAIPVIIHDGNIILNKWDSADDIIVGHLTEGFCKNHRNTDYMQGTMVMIDRGEGEFTNKGSRVFIDLSQKIDRRNIEKVVDAYMDFADAVASIPTNGQGMEQ